MAFRWWTDDGPHCPPSRSAHVSTRLGVPIIKKVNSFLASDELITIANSLDLDQSRMSVAEYMS